MLRMKPITDAKQAELYYSKSDGGYYLDGDGIRREWGGSGAARLGLSGKPQFEQFARLIRGLDPHTGDQLTARLIDGRLCGWDLTASVPKGVTLAAERGDSRIPELIWAANRKAMGDVQGYATTRVRVGGQQEDRRTDNLLWYSDQHLETRPEPDLSQPADHPWRLMPDPDFHIHNVVFNLTDDAEEDRWKAVKFRPIMDLRKFFDRRFDHYLSGMLADAGYSIATELRPDRKGKLSYYSWDIEGIPETVVGKFSRRSQRIDATEAEILAGLEERHGEAPDRLSAVARDQLGATSRLHKLKDVTLAECREYWDSRYTDEEADAIAATIEAARRSVAVRPERAAERALDFAIRHHGEQQSVIGWEQLLTTAMEKSMGQAMPGEIEAAADQLGIIVREKDGRKLATTRELQREESFIAGWASRGMGTVRPLGVPAELERGRLNAGQWDAATGLLESSNRVNVVEGPAGAGKSYMLKKFDEGVRLAGQHVTYLATTSDAAKVLGRDGFDCKTVAHFLLDERLQQQARGGRVVVDESSLLGHADAYRLYKLAAELDLTLIHVGDPLQHGSIGRGALLRVLKEYGHVQPFKLSEIMRQRDAGYRMAVGLLSEGKTLAGFDALDGKGWVEEIADGEDRTRQIAADYVQAVEDGKSVICISPTHAEAGRISEEIRSQLRAAGKLSQEEREFTRLVAVGASEAERGEQIYRLGDVLCFHQNAKGGIVKGTRLVVNDPADVPLSEAAKFQLYRPEAVSLAVGDKLRFTGTVKTHAGESLKNGDARHVAGFTQIGDIRLDDGQVIAGDAGHFRLGFVDTSFSSQGQTVDRAIVAMPEATLPAVSQEQLYVSASRAREKLTIYTDDKEAVREAIQASSRKLAALDLLAGAEAEDAERRRQEEDYRRRLAMIESTRAAWDMPALPHRIEAIQQERQAGHGLG